jgi:hypothetical protein
MKRNAYTRRIAMGRRVFVCAVFAGDFLCPPPLPRVLGAPRVTALDRKGRIDAAPGKLEGNSHHKHNRLVLTPHVPSILPVVWSL